MAYEYGAKEPEKLKIKDMTPKEKELLLDSESFCMMPWLHIHAFPDGRAYPCCFALDKYPVGDLNKDSMETVFNGKDMRQIRQNMLSNKKSKHCTKCYDQEKSGFFSLRLSSNKHFGHNIGMVENTQADGSADFVIKYWDIRFSNDIWEQMLEQFEHVEQFYFAGGEPLIMEEHYRILKELDRRKMYHVRLIYNTNFTKLKFKDMDVLELWNKFDSVSIGASLDAEGARGEFMRKGTVWKDIVANRKRMIEVCPKVDFYISSTVGLINALHIVDFHRSWVDQGLLKPQDFNFNLLQFPYGQRIDLLPDSFKQKVKEKYEKHIEWLRPLDHLTRATKGFEAGLDYMMRRDNSKDLQQFKDSMKRIDDIRDENILEAFPELTELYEKD